MVVLTLHTALCTPSSIKSTKNTSPGVWGKVFNCMVLSSYKLMPKHLGEFGENIISHNYITCCQRR